MFINQSQLDGLEIQLLLQETAFLRKFVSPKKSISKKKKNQQPEIIQNADFFISIKIEIKKLRFLVT